MSTATQSDLQELVAQGVARVAGTLDAHRLGREMGDYLTASIPEFTDVDDPDFRAGITMSCTSNLLRILDVLVNGSAMESATPPDDAIAWAHELVHRGMPLAALLRAYRLGHGLLERTFEESAANADLEPDVRWRVLAHTSREVFTYIDGVCTQLVDDYENEREQWLRGAAAAQAEMVRAIVAGEAVDEEEAIRTLRHDVAATQVAFIVWAPMPPRTGDPESSLTAVAKAAAAALGGAQTLVVPMGEHVVWGWTTGEGVLRRTPPRTLAREGRARVATGAPHAGLAGMHRSHHEAVAARRVAGVFGARPGAVVRYSAVALTALMSADPAQAADFVEAELCEELRSDSDAMLRLRATLAVYLDERLSPLRTARRLGIHQNTVIYRVKRAEELLGRPLDERRLELEVALRLFDGLEQLRALGGRRG